MRNISKEGGPANIQRKKEENSQYESKNEDNKSKKGENEGISKIRGNKIRNKQTRLIDEQIKDKPAESFK